MEKKTGTSGGWRKFSENPVLGGAYGTCFDLSMLRRGAGYEMYFSWRDRASIARTCSRDGVHWSEVEICLAPRETPQGWENRLNRPSVMYREGKYHLWYTGQRHWSAREGTSHIFYVVSGDGLHFERVGDGPVLAPDEPWENTSVMNPCVLWENDRYKMWYSAGAQYEPKAIGYAESPDGIHWTKIKQPVFECNPKNSWEQHKVAGCQVIRRERDYLMFYIGYYDEDYAQIGMARSKDGVSGWERFAGNPILAPDPGAWDGEACYKPFALQEDNGWKLWYNGRKGTREQIGLAVHPGTDLHF